MKKDPFIQTLPALSSRYESALPHPSHQSLVTTCTQKELPFGSSLYLTIS